MSAAEVFHPGAYLADELVARGIPQNRFAEMTGMTQATVSNLINCRLTVTTNTAVRLEAALGISAESWLRLQMAWDLHHARKEATRKTRLVVPE